MRRVPAADEKPLHWVGSAKRDSLSFPASVKDDMGNALGIAQFGGTAPTAKPWKGLGPGVLEIVESHDGNAYRAVYTVRFEKAVYVLHAFQKKSPSGIRTAKRDFVSFPATVKDDMGNALGIAQFGGTAPTAKPWKGLGSGVLEVVESHDGNAYRAVYTVRFERAVYVLHVFQKKSPSGIRTAKPDVDLIAERLKTAERDHEEHYGKSKR